MMGWSIDVYRLSWRQRRKLQKELDAIGVHRTSIPWCEMKTVTGTHWSYTGYSDWLDLMSEDFRDVWYMNMYTFYNWEYSRHITSKGAKKILKELKKLTPEVLAEDWHSESMILMCEKTIECNGVMRWR